MAEGAATILMVDDDAAFRRIYGRLLRGAGHRIREADTRPLANQAAARGGIDLVLLDLMLPPDGSVQGGLEQLSALKAALPGVPIIVVSGAGDTRFMIQAVGEGAYDFLTKPVDPDVLEIVVGRALTKLRLAREVGELRGRLADAAPAHAMVGQSPAFLRAVSLGERVAPSGLPVLITGENGTGKELMARAIHDGSRRSRAPFVAVNCGALPETLLASTLFGHVRGAFTGANRDHPGLFVEAHGGSIFLDEVGDMPPSLQVTMLRALESGEITPVGAVGSTRVDVRIISATNRDLDVMMAEGQFREDLYWRLKGVELRLPPLRERIEDIPLLATHFLNLGAPLTPDGLPRRLSPEATESLLGRPWTGNLRELRHEMQRGTVMAGQRLEIQLEDLSPFDPGGGLPPGATLHEKVEALEQREISLALESHRGNRTHAAEALGLSRQGLLNKMARYGVG